MRACVAGFRLIAGGGGTCNGQLASPAACSAAVSVGPFATGDVRCQPGNQTVVIIYLQRRFFYRRGYVRHIAAHKQRCKYT